MDVLSQLRRRKIFLAQGHELPTEANQALVSRVKGKGKGAGDLKGKGKGKGQTFFNDTKGKGNGKSGKGYGEQKGSLKGNWSKGAGKGKGIENVQCHGCLQYGHYVRDCPNRKLNPIEENFWPAMQFAGAQPEVTLILTEQPFKGYKPSFDHVKPQISNASQVVPTQMCQSAICAMGQSKPNLHAPLF